MYVPTGNRELISFATELIEQCRVSVGQRSAYCRVMNVISETGRGDGGKALINTLHNHLERTAAHLFSPVELKFAVDFDRVYPQQIYDRAAVVAKQITRQWDRTDTDILFGRGVFESLKYGACIHKQWPQVEGKQQTPTYYSKLILPWMFGVYNECETDISKQPALCETSLMTLPEVWRRICHLPNPKKLYDRIRTHASKGQGGGDPGGYFHQLLSSSQLQTGVNGGGAVIPGGIVGITSAADGVIGPQIAAETVQVHELWVQDDEDYTTIIMVDPDIIIAPYGRKMNLLGVEGQQPYRLIQANETTNYFWGRSELVDIVEPQAFLSVLMDDLRRLIGLQVDKILAFVGDNGIDDEKYGQFRSAGYVTLQQGSDVKDLTPDIPAELMPVIKFVIEIINTLSGFPEIMQGKGEPGVRAGVHADTLMKTASPTLRDRALLIERKCAKSADLTLAIAEAKDPSRYWTKADKLEDIEESSFLLTDLPEDWRVTVDSHSSSPIFINESQQTLFALRKMGDVDGEYMLDNMPIPNRDDAKAKLRIREKAKAAEKQQLLQQFPEMGEKLAMRQLIGGRGR